MEILTIRRKLNTIFRWDVCLCKITFIKYIKHINRADIRFKFIKRFYAEMMIALFIVTKFYIDQLSTAPVKNHFTHEIP